MRSIIFSLFLALSPVVVAQDTMLHLYNPFPEKLQDPKTVKKPGICREQSHLLKREDAWRCEDGQIIYDPCFVARFGTRQQAVCVAFPESTSATLIETDSPLNNSRHEFLDMSHTLPWVVELEDGQKCHLVEAGGDEEGLPIHYQCGSQGVLIGHLQRCKSQWQMLYKHKQQASLVKIRNAWF